MKPKDWEKYTNDRIKAKYVCILTHKDRCYPIRIDPECVKCLEADSERGFVWYRRDTNEPA